MGNPLNDLDPDICIFEHGNTCSCYTPSEFNSFFVKNEYNFSLIHMNARSLNRNFDSITNLLDTLSNKFSIIALSETWICGKPVTPFHLHGYTFIHSDRAGCVSRGGGVALFVKDDITCTVRDDIFNTYDNSTCEYLFVDITLGPTLKYTVGVIYRKPNSDLDVFFQFYNELLLRVSRRSLIITGDFNIDLSNLTNNNSANTFVNLNCSFGLYKLITTPTRITVNSATLIDNIFTNLTQSKCTSGTICTDVTDHLPVFSLFNIDNYERHRKTFQSYTRKISNENIAALLGELYRIDWTFLNNLQDIEQMYDAFLSVITIAYNKCLPLVPNKSERLKIRKPWINKSLIRCIQKKNKLYKKFIHNRSFVNENKFKSYRNKVNNLLRKAKKHYFCLKFGNSKNDIKGTWKTINTLLNKSKPKLPTYIMKDGKMVENDQSIADEFNSYFISSCSGFDANNRLAQVNTISHTNYLHFPTSSSIFFKPISQNELIEVCKSLRNTKSCGYDNIGCNVLKQIIHAIVKPLVYIFNISLSTGTFPSKLKIAKIIPVFKKDDRHSLKNYRPISLLPCISKLLEKCVYNRLYSFLFKHNILTDCQFGFRRNHSTTHALIDLQDKVTLAMEKNNFCIGIFMDLSKAFDIVDHSILLSKLNFYGVRGNPLNFFKSYLCNRRQFTMYNNNVSDFADITHGVPQGSILGPLLFFDIY